MIMMNILVRDHEVTRELRFENKFYVNICTDINQISNGVPTLIIGYDLAKETFKDVKPNMHEINRFYFWCKLDDTNYMIEFHDYCVTKFLDHIDHGIDPVFDDFDIEYFVDNLNDFPLIHQGRYELYVAEKRGDDIIVHSIKHDALRYVKMDPDETFYNMIDLLDGDCLVLSTDEYDLLSSDEGHPVFVYDLLQAQANYPDESWQNSAMMDIVGKFSPRYMSKAEMLTFYMRKIAHLRRDFVKYASLDVGSTNGDECFNPLLKPVLSTKKRV